MAQKRRFYKLQCTALAKLMYERRTGDWTIAGPREDDGALLIIRRCATGAEPWLMKADGTLSYQFDYSKVDPSEFGIRWVRRDG